jgi:hypothetical protein
LFIRVAHNWVIVVFIDKQDPAIREIRGLIVAFFAIQGGAQDDFLLAFAGLGSGQYDRVLERRQSGGLVLVGNERGIRGHCE